jgi:8-oxo-dGTP pyrophosphatase MutT (NUDIX family)
MNQDIGDGRHALVVADSLRPDKSLRAQHSSIAAASCFRHAPVVAHIHEKIDFTVAIFVVHGGKVLLIHHRKLDKWLPLGGHIELDEDPEQAALREAREESGLDVDLLGERPPTTGPGTRALIAPRFLDIHRITDTHEHIGMIYWARPKGGSTTLAVEEHHDIRWCPAADLDMLTPTMSEAVKWYCRKAIEEVSGPACHTSG